MNYWLHKLGILSLIIDTFVLLLILLGVSWLVYSFAAMLRLPERFQTLVAVIAYVLGLGLGSVLIISFNLHFYDGELRQLFIVQDQGQTRLAAWFTAEYNGKVSTWYAQKGKTFELNSGKTLKQEILAWRSYEKNSPSYRPKGLIAVEPQDWLFEPVTGSVAKTLRRGSAKGSAQSLKMIAPKLVRELDPETAQNTSKVWVIHYSTYLGDYETYLSYLDARGQELARLNLRRLFNDKYAAAFASYSRGKDTLVFITCDGYTLSALRLDPVTGKLLGRINYL